MRHLYLALLAVLFNAMAAHAQQPLMIDPVKDKKEIQGFTISLRPAPGNSVLFEISKQGQPRFNQPMNPLTMMPEGFASKEDAFKVAEWMIREYGKQSHPFPPIVPPHVARELKITDPFNPPSPKQ